MVTVTVKNVRIAPGRLQRRNYKFIQFTIITISKFQKSNQSRPNRQKRTNQQIFLKKKSSLEIKLHRHQDGQLLAEFLSATVFTILLTVLLLVLHGLSLGAPAQEKGLFQSSGTQQDPDGEIENSEKTFFKVGSRTSVTLKLFFLHKLSTSGSGWDLTSPQP